MKFSISVIIFVALQFFYATNSFTIDCDFYLNSLRYVVDVYHCNSRNFSIQSNNKVTRVTGVHENGYYNSDVESIYINGQYNLSFIPIGLTNFFANIKAITIWFTNIETFYGDEFDEFAKLQYLDFKHSHLKTISSWLFEKTPNLISVDFGLNSIEKVGYDLFKPFLNRRQMQFVGFENNTCIDRFEHGPRNVFDLIEEIQVKCPFNDEFPITTPTEYTTTTTSEIYTTDMPSTTFPEYTRTTSNKISTSDNPTSTTIATEQSTKAPLEYKAKYEYRMASYYHVGDVYECYSIKILTPSGKIITDINGEHLEGKTFSDVESIFINGNFNLQYIPYGFSKFFMNIKAFSIHNTVITSIFDELDEFPQLVYFDIQNNNLLKTIPSDLFLNTPNMISFDFGYNYIEKVGRDLFTTFEIIKLQFISFYNNFCVSRYESNQTGIKSLIIELKIKCPYNDEPKNRRRGKCICWDRQSRSRKIKIELG